MAGPYIPPKDSDLANWATNFDALVSVNYASYGLSGGQATAVTAVVAAYNAAYTLATDPGTRTPATVADKDSAKFALLGTVRPVAIFVRNNPAVSDMTKIALGLTVPSTTPTPVPTPTTVPVLSVLAATPGVHRLVYRDEDSITSKAKAFGAIQMQLFVAFGTAPAPDPSTASLIGVFTKSPLLVDLPVEQAGKVATYFARWVTRRGLVGSWSAGASLIVAF